MKHTIIKATAARLAASLNAQRRHSATVRPATARSQLLGYHVSLNGVNVTENEVEACNA